MTEKIKPETPPPRESARQERLKAALRENLKRRKAQARERGEGAAENEEAGEP